MVQERFRGIPATSPTHPFELEAWENPNQIMKQLRYLWLLALVAAWQLPARADSTNALSGDLAKLQGEWRMSSGSADGFEMPEGMLASSRRICTGDRLTVTVRGQLIMKAKITLNVTAKPKTIDYEVSDGPTKGKKLLGIYELEGDVLKSCFGAPGEARPTEFASTTGDHRTVSSWKRQKPAADPPGK